MPAVQKEILLHFFLGSPISVLDSYTLTVQNTQFEFGTQIDIGKYRMGVVILWQSVI